MPFVVDLGGQFTGTEIINASMKLAAKLKTQGQPNYKWICEKREEGGKILAFFCPEHTETKERDYFFHIEGLDPNQRYSEIKMHLETTGGTWEDVQYAPETFHKEPAFGIFKQMWKNEMIPISLWLVDELQKIRK